MSVMGPLWLDEDESFSMTAYVESPGPVRVALQGYITERRFDGLYAAPLIPQLFFGFDGTQLQTWRQDITVAGSQVILSRSGGLPKVPREELFWRKVSDTEAPVKVEEKPSVVALELPSWIPWVLGGLVATGILVVVYKLSR